MKYQDIHRSDAAFWSQYKQYIAAGKYDEAASLIGEVDDKALIAEVFNYMTGQDGDYTKPNLKTLQEHQSSTFKQDRIQVATEPPSGLESGQVYFQFDRNISDKKLEKGTIIAIGSMDCVVLNVSGTIVEIYTDTSFTAITIRDSSFNGLYSGSQLDTYLNSTYYNALPDDVKNAIVDKHIIQYEYESNPSVYDANTHASYADYSTKKQKEVVGLRKVYALDVEDIENYFGGVFSVNDLRATFNMYPVGVMRDRGFGLRSVDKNENSFSCYSSGIKSGLILGVNPTARFSFQIDLSKIDYEIVK